MAGHGLDKPGTHLGPCIEPCDHYDCRSQRKMAATLCACCGKPVGYENRYSFTRVTTGGNYEGSPGIMFKLAHKECEEAGTTARSVVREEDKEGVVMIDQQQTESEIAAEGGRSRRMDLLCPACGHKLGSTMSHPEPFTRDHRSVTFSVVLDSAPTRPLSGESAVSPGEQ